jgi:hypothetical protein
MEVVLGCFAVGIFGVIAAVAESEPQSEKKNNRRKPKKRLSQKSR